MKRKKSWILQRVRKALGINGGYVQVGGRIAIKMGWPYESPLTKSGGKKLINRYASECLNISFGLRPQIPSVKPLYEKNYREKAKEFYNSDLWRKLRYQALQICGAKCQCCGASRNDGVVLHVDHIKPRYHYPKLELELSNLQVLCEDCNLGKGAWDETDWRSMFTDQINHMKNL